MAFNPDDFIAGISAAQTPVTIFKAADVAGHLRAVEADLELLAGFDDEQTLDAGAERAELIEKRDRLQNELQDSAEEFIVQALEQDRIDELTKEARKTAKDRADQAAKDAAGYAREECRRAEIGDGKEIKDAVRRASLSASEAVMRKEAGIHIISHAVVTDTGERAFTPEQMRVVSEKLGDTQMDKLYKAFYDLTSNDPGELIPKSRKPGPTVED
ncbi:hypothetical protein [Brevibacterium sp. ZH18]|uniref:hypothetical protein n=1 Tax=Brevibacterium sp. ZH18 TaxID=2927784 RepID=UPI001F60ED26|nr:hypothetical protein [Brevibacterium sp. ZH18]MCI4012380.1 hypothetical protein [Brevibacterium sp. ZH18]